MFIFICKYLNDIKSALRSWNSLESRTVQINALVPVYPFYVVFSLPRLHLSLKRTELLLQLPSYRQQKQPPAIFVVTRPPTQIGHYGRKLHLCPPSVLSFSLLSLSCHSYFFRRLSFFLLDSYSHPRSPTVCVLKQEWKTFSNSTSLFVSYSLKPSCWFI